MARGAKTVIDKYGIHCPRCEPILIDGHPWTGYLVSIRGGKKLSAPTCRECGYVATPEEIRREREAAEAWTCTRR
jgi:hypothetical protein